MERYLQNFTPKVEAMLCLTQKARRPEAKGVRRERSEHPQIPEHNIIKPLNSVQR